MKDFFDELINIEEPEEIIETIKNMVNSAVWEEYIPVLFESQSIFEGAEIDFYAKFIILDHRKTINNTWILNNFEKYIPNSFDKDKGAYNLITLKNYKSNFLYDLNPSLYSENYIYEDEVDNNRYVNLRIVDQVNNNPYVFKQRDNYNGVKLMMNKEVLIDFVEFNDSSESNFKLVLEFEIRSKTKLKLKEFEGEIKGNYIEIADISNSKISETSFMIRGSIEIDNLEFNKVAEKLDLKTFTLEGQIRNYNEKNYDDDINAGILVFSNEAIDDLKDEFYFFDHVLYSKSNPSLSIIVDQPENYIAFWEGEFNKLPKNIRHDLKKHNITERNGKAIITPAMIEWQLKANWDYMDYSEPFIKLANYARSNYKNISIDNGLTFFYPRNLKELHIFLVSIKSTFNLSPHIFNSSSKDVKILIEVYENKNTKEGLEILEIRNLVEKYSYAVLKRLGESDD